MAGATALAVAALTARGRGRDLDVRLYRQLNGGGGRSADALLSAITELGSMWASVGAGATLALRGRRRAAVDAVGAASAMWLAGQILKKAIGRPRPYASLSGIRLLIGKPAGTSWPSSHPAVLLAFTTVAARDLGASDPVKVGVIALAGLVALSRVYLGVHFPSDVAGGLLVGRGVADLWSAVVSPRVLDTLPDVDVPVE
jgi:membrane-associated phospholipid phosphatase